MNRPFVLFLCALSIISLNCTEYDKLTVHVGGAANEIAYWEDLATGFTEKTGIPISLIRTTTQTEQRKQSMIIALRGKKPDPDVLLLDVAWIGQLASSGWLTPLEQYGMDREPFFDDIIRLSDVWNNKLIGVPLYVDGGLLYYRKDLLESYGFRNPPGTWPELERMATVVMEGERSTNPDFWGYVWQGAQYEGLVCNALEFFVSAGGGFFDENMNPSIDSPSNLRALRFMNGMIHGSGISPPNTYTDMKEEEVRLVFQNGNALFERNWPYAFGLHRDSDSEVRGKFDIAPLPRFEGGRSVSTLGGWHVGISAFSDRKRDAARFITYITSCDIQKDLARDLGWNPGRTDVYDDPELIADYPVLARLKGIFSNAVPRPTVPYYSEISVILQKYINRSLAGAMDPEEALDAAHDEVNSVVERYETF